MTITYRTDGLTPKKVAMILLKRWFTLGGTNPLHMSIQEMNFIMESHEYIVTEKRLEHIQDTLRKVMESWEAKVDDYLIRNGIDF